MNYVYVAAGAFFAGVGIGTFVLRSMLTTIAAEVRAEAVKTFDSLYARAEAVKKAL